MRTTHRRSFRVTAGAFAGLTVLSLGLAACGGEEEPGADPQEAVDAPEAEEPATWPLTGLPADEGAEQDHPVLVVKMDNTEASAPQEGLGSADLVVEELVEGGITRLAAFYYSDIPGVVGPVRSVRASDIGIVSPADGTLVTSGGAQVTLGRLKEAGIPLVSEGSEGFRRDDTRSAPYNLFADLSAVAKAQAGEAARPDDYLPWGTAADLPKGKPATSLTADFGSHATNWTFENGTYVNQNTYAAEGEEFPADSVLVLRVDVGDAGYLDPAGNPVPETLFEGEGQAQLFHDGKVVEGTWTKDGLEDAISLSTRDGELTVPAGRVWIELVPVDAKNGSVTYQK
ncbi:hypothetical protein HNR19_001056 [Nocardioides thalensis]|uniref:DUF3048 domain-containing protein n=1 Tax=Nocardioides thalensis TaxID=1914755 RepID=A0A853C167_9ACTN|nr:hypothetical protein [Nocardioides thalensis]